MACIVAFGSEFGLALEQFGSFEFECADFGAEVCAEFFEVLDAGAGVLDDAGQSTGRTFGGFGAGEEDGDKCGVGSEVGFVLGFDEVG